MGSDKESQPGKIERARGFIGRILGQHGREKQAGEEYAFLYRLVQAHAQRAGPEFLATQRIPQGLSKISDLDQALKVIRRGKSDLTDEDITHLHVEIAGRYSRLKDKAGLPDPKDLFSSIAGR